MTIRITNKEMLVSIIAITPRYGPLEYNSNNNMIAQTGEKIMPVATAELLVLKKYLLT